MSIESVMPPNHLILCHSLLLLSSIFPSIRVFSNESALCIRWLKYWIFSISSSNEYSGLTTRRLAALLCWCLLCSARPGRQTLELGSCDYLPTKAKDFLLISHVFVTAVSQERLYYCLVGKRRFKKLRTLSEVRQPEVAQAGIRIQKSLVPEAKE